MYIFKYTSLFFGIYTVYLFGTYKIQKKTQHSLNTLSLFIINNISQKCINPLGCHEMQLSSFKINLRNYK